MAGKQAKVLSTAQISTVLTHLSATRHSARDRAMFLLSVKAGMRAKEIASITWSMVLTAERQIGDTIHLEDRATKRDSGRAIPINKDLMTALSTLFDQGRQPDMPVVYSERGAGMSANSVAQWFLALYKRLGFLGCSSHSGRRTFVTTAARKVALVGGSLRDVQLLAGHRSLAQTATYIDGDNEAQRKLVNII